MAPDEAVAFRSACAATHDAHVSGRAEPAECFDPLSKFAPECSARRGVTLGSGLLSSFAHGPLLIWALLAGAYGEGFGAAWELAFTGYAGAFLCALSAARVQQQKFSWLPAINAPLYWPLQSCAALRALVELFIDPHAWAKTEHGLTKNQPAMPDCAAPQIVLLASNEVGRQTLAAAE